MSEEINKRICKNCRVIKDRLQDGYFPNRKDKVWIDPISKRQWNGSTCPDCVKEMGKNRMRQKRKVCAPEQS